jgi:hexosaminidase
MEFFVSGDGQKFEKVGEALNDVDPLSGEKQLKNYTAAFEPRQAAFVKIVSKNLGKCPKGHAGEGKAAWMFLDEVIVE